MKTILNLIAEKTRQEERSERDAIKVTRVGHTINCGYSIIKPEKLIIRKAATMQPFF
jgi:hypothetical protein